jgi:peptide/nickel transport system substrate-binding protein
LGRLAALVAAAALSVGVAVAPGGRVSADASPEASTPPQGGTLRIVVPPGPNTDLVDPQPTSLDPQLGGWFGFELWRCCLVRTLYSVNGRRTEEGGSEVHPDLAAALPEVSADGLSWRIPIRAGLHYAPPLQDIEITAHDFVRSFERLLAPTFAESGGFYWPFLGVEGATEYNAGEAASISGLEAPDDHTLVIKLTARRGNLASSLVTPGAGPLPPDPFHPEALFGVAAGADEGMGRFLVASGPYMVEGSERLDFSVPADRRAPATGEAPGRLTLVRNPSWDRTSDALRPAHADRMEIIAVDSMEEAVTALDAGTADLVWPSGGNMPTIPPEVYAAFQADPARGRVRVDATRLARYAILNVAVPPFDDLHVRRALNYAIDKQHLVDLEGGPVAADVQGHLLPDYLAGGLLLEYDPYATAGHEGDLDAARAEMAKSPYDTNGDGRCDAPVCEHVLATTRDPYSAFAAAVANDLEPLGIHLDVEVQDMETFFDTYKHPEARVPLLIGIGFGSAYIGGAAELQLDFDSSGIDDPPGTYNYTMVGATPEQLRKWGYDVTEVPNVDARIKACLPLVGAAQSRCAANLDQYLMENVVPWIPLTVDQYAAITSPRVVTYSFDALTGTTALDRIALEPVP